VNELEQAGPGCGRLFSPDQSAQVLPRGQKTNDGYRRANVSLWDEWAELHRGSAMYDLVGFKKGRTSLNGIELDEVGDVRGKTLLHLQCHFGLDTLSFARLGAKVTGVDFSDRATSLACSVRSEVGIKESDARFVCSDVYDLEGKLDGRFDIVYTSYGVLAWLRDLDEWSRLVTRFLSPKGFFYMVELHPFLNCFDQDSPDPSLLRVRFPYFPESGRPLRVRTHGSYADRTAHVKEPFSYQYDHPLSEVVSALTKHGLRVEFLHEFPFCYHRIFPWLVQKKGDNRWVFPRRVPSFPLLFSIKASRPLGKGRT
jgi:SAM-dependent methyltransferase